jgi:hypothetical protein
MGVGFSSESAGLIGPHWAYGGFGRFRRRLAESEGFALDEMEGFKGRRSWSDVATPLEPLLNHSDCDGELTPEECAQVAPRLREVISTWLPDDYDARSGMDLADAMEQCAANDENLEFC